MPRTITLASGLCLLLLMSVLTHSLCSFKTGRISVKHRTTQCSENTSDWPTKRDHATRGTGTPIGHHITLHLHLISPTTSSCLASLVLSLCRICLNPAMTEQQRPIENHPVMETAAQCRNGRSSGGGVGAGSRWEHLASRTFFFLFFSKGYSWHKMFIAGIPFQLKKRHRHHRISFFFLQRLDGFSCFALGRGQRYVQMGNHKLIFDAIIFRCFFLTQRVGLNLLSRIPRWTQKDSMSISAGNDHRQLDSRWDRVICMDRLPWSYRTLCWRCGRRWHLHRRQCTILHTRHQPPTSTTGSVLLVARAKKRCG